MAVLCTALASRIPAALTGLTPAEPCGAEDRTATRNWLLTNFAWTPWALGHGPRIIADPNHFLHVQSFQVLHNMAIFVLQNS